MILPHNQISGNLKPTSADEEFIQKIEFKLLPTT